MPPRIRRFASFYKFLKQKKCHGLSRLRKSQSRYFAVWTAPVSSVPNRKPEWILCRRLPSDCLAVSLGSFRSLWPCRRSEPLTVSCSLLPGKPANQCNIECYAMMINFRPVGEKTKPKQDRRNYESYPNSSLMITPYKLMIISFGNQTSVLWWKTLCVCLLNKM